MNRVQRAFGLMVLFLSIEFLLAQSPDTLWTKTIGSDGSDLVRSCVQTEDSGFVFTGFSIIPGQGGLDAWLVKTDAQGKVEWNRKYGSDQTPELGRNAVQTSDGGYAILANKYDAEMQANVMWFVKTKSNGDTMWTRSYTQFGGVSADWMQNTIDGGYIIVLSHFETENIILLKIDHNGDISWDKKYGREFSDFATHIIQTEDKGYALCGASDISSSSSDGRRTYIIKTDSLGDSLWARTYSISNYDEPSCIKETKDGNYIVTGSLGEDQEAIFIAEFDQDGILSWSKEYTRGLHQFARSIDITSKNNCIIAGSLYSSDTPDSKSDIWVIKTDANGDTIWTKVIGGANDDDGWSAIKATDNNYVIASTYGVNESNVDTYLMKLENDEIVAGFSNDVSNGRIPLNVTFSDSAIQYVTSWQWDFDNDGIINSYEQNPTSTYFNDGTFSVKFIVANPFYSDTLVKENLITAHFDTIPNLYSIKDVPNDQGGWVNVSFARSFYDTDTLNTLESYSIEINDGSGWTSALDTLTSAKNIYSVLVSTPIDSSASSDGLLNFRVIANMNEGIFISDSLKGYSVDNIPPSSPKNLNASITSEEYVLLSWQPAHDEDLDHYLIFKSEDGFSYEVLATTTDTSYVDSDVEFDNEYYYAVRSVDRSGNRSDISNLVSITVTDISMDDDIPLNYYLTQNYPNPFNPNTTIKYGLKEPVDVSIIIFDNLGRKIIELINTKQNAGHYQIVWNGKNYLNHQVSSGIYYYRIETDKFNEIKKMIFIK
jgi:PKD repeat protein